MGSGLFLADEWLNAYPWDPLLAAAVLLTIAAIPIGVRIGISIQRRRRREAAAIEAPARPPQ